VPKTIALTVLLIAAVVMAGHFVGFAAESDNPLPPGNGPFTGKIISVRTASIAPAGYYSAYAQGVQLLERAQVKQLGGKQFLVGKNVTIDPDEPKIGHTVWLPVDSIQEIREFDSVEEAKKAYPAPVPPYATPAPPQAGPTPAPAAPGVVPAVPAPAPLPAPTLPDPSSVPMAPSAEAVPTPVLPAPAPAAPGAVPAVPAPAPLPAPTPPAPPPPSGTAPAR